MDLKFKSELGYNLGLRKEEAELWRNYTRGSQTIR
jgi:hypothetical protein